MASIGRRKFRCGHWKIPSNIVKRWKSEKGIQCWTCRKAQHNRWMRDNPEKVKERLRRREQELRAPILEKQKGCCGICRVKFDEKTHRPYLDHRHSCCSVGTKGCEKCRRGLLCPDCNTKLAALEKPGWKEKAERYLRKWRAQ